MKRDQLALLAPEHVSREGRIELDRVEVQVVGRVEQDVILAGGDTTSSPSDAVTVRSPMPKLAEPRTTRLSSGSL